MQAIDILAQEFGRVADLIHAHAAERPNAPALMQDERALSYAELDRLMDRVAAALARDGVAHRDVIAICANSSLEYAATFLGALRAGVAVAPLAPSSSPESLAGMIADSGAKVFFLDSAVDAALAGFDIALQPAAVDYASPLKVFEYMAAGRAIILADGRTRALTHG